MERFYQMTRADEIFEKIKPFCENYLNDELTGYAQALLLTVQKNRRLNIFRGDLNSWAAAVVYAIARLNFLFDRDDAHYVTPELICDYFNTEKKATMSKADHIIEVCGLVLGDKKFSGKNITSMFNYYKTKVGFIVHKSALENRIKNIEALEPTEAKRLRQYVAEKSFLAEKKLRDRLIQRSKKKQTVQNGQLDMFDI